MNAMTMNDGKKDLGLRDVIYFWTVCKVDKNYSSAISTYLAIN
jgi:hypothetical protein